MPGWTIINGDGKRATIKNTRWRPRLVDTMPGLFRIPWLSFWSKVRMAWASVRLYLIPHRKYRPLDDYNGYDLGGKLGYDHAGAMSWDMASLGLTNQFVDGDPAVGDPGLSGPARPSSAWRPRSTRPTRPSTGSTVATAGPS